ncbi:MAG TPA: tail fiber domain-containing protein [Leptospiraceae bacterium]|nr:tail fiber domain-containing protein [Leptospiraceae bacterium]HMW05762.1 tail fiber domain-containing protein [Leptospiraceae bacterium]HMX33854.1 tail fiber domain-containing protein [Leptospiraceae bacterium]HMY33363.1 tail fiber domain-containing protein [Leptospiraceae bacterium]HMZ65436.1 tail fiber domain-containing protein [Leptospiraceae bacterium]
MNTENKEQSSLNESIDKVGTYFSKQKQVIKESLFKGAFQGVGFLLAIGVTTVLAVAVTGTINTFSSGGVIKSADINTNFTTLKTAIEGITSSQWTTNGANIGYTAGNVGVGTTSPSEKLSVKGTGSFSDSNTVASNFLNVASDTAAINIITHGSNYGSTLYGVSRNNMGLIEGQSNSAFVIGTSNTAPIIFGVNRTENMRIGTNGNVGIGTTSPSDNFSVGNKVLISSSSSPSNPPAGGAVLFMNVGNDLIAKDSTGQNLNIGDFTASDKRLKKDIIPIIGALDKIKELSAVYFNWDRSVKRVSDYSEKRQLGLIAQEIEKQIPEIVSIDSFGYKRMEYTKMIPVLVSATQEQQKEIERLSSNLISAREENSQLRKRLERVESVLAAVERQSNEKMVRK